MESPSFGRSVRRVTSFERDSAGSLVPVTVYQQRRRRAKKGSRLLKPLESAVRRWADASDACAEKYAERHRRSNRKKRDGWLRDLGANGLAATRAGAKKLKVYRLFGL